MLGLGGLDIRSVGKGGVWTDCVLTLCVLRFFAEGMPLTFYILKVDKGSDRGIEGVGVCGKRRGVARGMRDDWAVCVTVCGCGLWRHGMHRAASAFEAVACLLCMLRVDAGGPHSGTHQIRCLLSVLCPT